MTGRTHCACVNVAPADFIDATGVILISVWREPDGAIRARFAAIRGVHVGAVRSSWAAQGAEDICVQFAAWLDTVSLPD